MAVNFNYTRTLSLLLGNCSQSHTTLNLGGQRRSVIFHEPIRVHGTLSDRNAVFGVCDKADVKGFDRDSDMEYLFQLLLKRENEKVHKKGHEVRRAWDALSNSDVIVIFGMSLGASDSYWWNGIGALLTRNGAAKLVYATHFKCSKSDKNEKLCNVEYDGLTEEMYVRVVKTLHLTEAVAHDRVLMLGAGPHCDFDGEVHCFDPLHLFWFSKHVLNVEKIP